MTSSDNPFPEGRHEEGWPKEDKERWDLKKHDPSKMRGPGEHGKARKQGDPPTLDQRLRIMEATAEIQSHMGVVRLAVVSMYHDIECLKREKQALVDGLIERTACKRVLFHRDGTISLDMG